MKQGNEKTKKFIKYAKIAGAASATALSIASCVVNPLNAGVAVSSFVHLVNLIFGGSTGTTSDELGLGKVDDQADLTSDEDGSLESQLT